MFYFIKVIISAILIVVVSEIAKRSSFVGGIIASIPLISFLAIIFLYTSTKNTQAVAALSHNIFWMVLPSLVLFITLPIFLKVRLNFYVAISLSTALTVASYFLMILILEKSGIRL